MLDKYKKDFTELVKKINTLDVGMHQGNSDNLHTATAGVENEYRKIHCHVLTKHEEMTIVSDILNNLGHAGDSTAQSRDNDSLSLAASDALGNARDYALFEMPRQVAPFHLDKGICLYKEGNIQKALEYWEKVLRVDPDNACIHAHLNEMQHHHAGTEKSLAKKIQRKYQFKYLGNFGQGIVKRPLSIQALDGHGVYILDHGEGLVHHFSTHCDYLGPLDLNLKNPLGLFTDDRNNFWICDSGNSRLLKIDTTGKRTSTIRLAPLLPNDDDMIYPAFGCGSQGLIFLVLMDQNHQRRRIVVIDTDQGMTVQEIMAPDCLQLPEGIEIDGDHLYLTDFLARALYVYNMKQRRLYPLLQRSLQLNPPRRCVVTGDALFVTAGQTISKLRLNGETIFTVDLAASTQNKSVHPLDLTMAKQAQENILFVTDMSMPGCIHRFLVA